MNVAYRSRTVKTEQKSRDCEPDDHMRQKLPAAEQYQTQRQKLPQDSSGLSGVDRTESKLGEEKRWVRLTT